MMKPWCFSVVLSSVHWIPVCSELDPVPSVTVRCQDTEDGHWQCGKAIGTKFSERIKSAFAQDAQLQQLVSQVNTSSAAEAVFQEFLSHAKRRYPLYVAELNGTSHGAGVDFDTVLIANFRQELSTAFNDMFSSSSSLQIPDACTDLMLVDSTHGVAGWTHNEDYALPMFNLVYFVRQSILGTDGQELYTISSLSYPGVLPGWAPSWNSYGLGFTWNVLYPSKMLTGPSAAVAFVCRDVLTARSIEEAIDLASPEDLALGQNLNVGSFHSRRIITVETAPGGLKNSLSIEDGASVTFHANEYLRIKGIPQFESHLISTRHRQQAFDTLVKRGLHSMHDLLWVEGDNSDAAYPIFRRNDTTHEDTLFTVAFDLVAQTISVYRDNARLGANAIQWIEYMNTSSAIVMI